VSGVGSTEPPRSGGAGFAGAGAGISIVSEVKERGLDAVREWAVELDGVPPRRAEAAADGLPREALLALADRVRRWHAVQRPADVSLEVEPGVVLERRWVPLDTVGVYVPRNLVSTLVMCVVPAQVAGVRRIVVCTPPDGAPLIAAAAALLGVDEVWALGGPQAIGFLAYVERVDKIVGPGNAYVNDAKLEVSRDVPIDLPGGPSEVVVLGGDDPRLVELELAAQREHGHEAVCRTVETLAEAEEIAPEHLVLLGEAEAYADRVQNAGSVFVGPWSPVAAGDYATGGNHVLPTNGWARSVGGLGLETFLKPVTVQRVTEEGLALIRPTVEALAAAEGMPAHAAAARR
jgi:histidinol dehydrogenase